MPIMLSKHKPGKKEKDFETHFSGRILNLMSDLDLDQGA